MRAKMPRCGQKNILIASRTLENQVSNRCEESENPTPVVSKRTPWNKGKLTGAKPPLRPKHVWSIRTKLQMADRKRDLALFNLAIDSKLRGCDVVALKVEDIAPHGYAIELASCHWFAGPVAGEQPAFLHGRSGIATRWPCLPPLAQ